MTVKNDTFQPLIPKRNDLKQILTNRIATVIFRKTDGEIREMRCTLKSEYLPKQQPLDENARHLPRQENDNVLSVWSIDNNGWRSFRIDSIMDIIPWLMPDRSDSCD